ncbi:YncE family protein [Streptacidiphilus sp. PAMC 29251]
MRLRQVSLATVVSVVAGAVSTLGITAAPAEADGSTVLAVSNYSHLVVDAAHQHLFFSQGAGSSSILVTDLSGNQVGTIPGEAGATGLVLSADGATLYAALSGGDAIAAIDTTTLAETTRYPTGAGSAPTSLALTGGTTLWYGYTKAAPAGTSPGAGGIGDIDTAASAPVATPQPAMSHWTQAPVLATGGGILAAEEPDDSLSHVATFDVTGTTTGTTTGTGATATSPRTVADTLVYGGTAASMAVTADGSRVLLAAPQQFQVGSFLTSTLLSATPGGYAGGATYGPDAVALAADGTIATGSQIASGPDVWLTASGKQPMSSFAFTPSTLAPDGLAWGGSGDGSGSGNGDGLSLYAVTRNSAGGYTLNVLSNPRLTDTALSLAVVGWPVPTQQFTLSGTLTTKGATPVGAALQVTRDGTALPDATVGADGSYSINDTVNAVGSYSYQVSYPGDPTHRPSTASLHLAVSKLSTDIPASDLSKVGPSGVVFSGTLFTELGVGIVPPGSTIQVTRVDTDTQQSTELPDAPIDPVTHTFTVSDVPGPGLHFRYDLTFAGNATLEASASSTSVSFQPDTPGLTLHAPSSANRAAQLTITGNLTDDPYQPYAAADENVEITKTDLAHPNGYSLGTAVVAADGSLSFQDTPQTGGPNVYTVSYPGDATHSAVTEPTTVQVSRAATAVSLATNAADYGYGATATVTAHLGTSYNGRTLSIYAQPYGGAKVLVRTGTVDAHGKLTASYRITRRTVFTVSFAGDYRTAPATASAVGYAYAQLAEAQAGYYTSTHRGSTLYRVYHHTAHPKIAVGVAPNKTGECVYFQVQEYSAGAWHTVISTSCQKLNSGSTAAGTLTLPRAAGHLYRFSARYAHSAADTANLSTAGPWQNFTFRT